MRVTCPKCAELLDVDERFQGHMVSCGQCGEVFSVPRSDPKPTPARQQLMVDLILENPAQEVDVTKAQCARPHVNPPSSGRWFTILATAFIIFAPTIMIAWFGVSMLKNREKGQKQSRSPVARQQRPVNQQMPPQADDGDDSTAAPHPVPRKTALPSAPRPSPEAIAARVKQLVAEANEKRDIQVARRQAIIARNKALAEKHGEELAAYQSLKDAYDADLPKYQAARREAAAVRRLEFARKLQTNIDAAETPAGANALRERLAQWYRDVVKEFPDTAAAKEARNRLAGKRPKEVAAPKVGPEPVAPQVPPMPSFEPEGRPIPAVDVEAIARLVADEVARVSTDTKLIRD